MSAFSTLVENADTLENARKTRQLAHYDDRHRTFKTKSPTTTYREHLPEREMRM